MVAEFVVYSIRSLQSCDCLPRSLFHSVFPWWSEDIWRFYPFCKRIWKEESHSRRMQIKWKYEKEKRNTWNEEPHRQSEGNKTKRKKNTKEKKDCIQTGVTDTQLYMRYKLVSHIFQPLVLSAQCHCSGDLIAIIIWSLEAQRCALWMEHKYKCLSLHYFRRKSKTQK